MPRILGVDIPNDKPTHISLRYIYGVGPTVALRLCDQAKIDPQRRAKELTDDDISRLASILDREYTVEGPLRRQVQQNITRLKDISCYRGFRHRREPELGPVASGEPVLSPALAAVLEQVGPELTYALWVLASEGDVVQPEHATILELHARASPPGWG